MVKEDSNSSQLGLGKTAVNIILTALNSRPNEIQLFVKNQDLELCQRTEKSQVQAYHQDKQEDDLRVLGKAAKSEPFSNYSFGTCTSRCRRKQHLLFSVLGVLPDAHRSCVLPTDMEKALLSTEKIKCVDRLSPHSGKCIYYPTLSVQDLKFSHQFH